jgi:very-short-patch-repair endonuclease
MTSIYLAGKIDEANDWRGRATSDKCFLGGRDNGLVRRRLDPNLLWPIKKRVVLNTLDYTGPYLSDCSHGPTCSRFLGDHAQGEDGEVGCNPDGLRSDIQRLCFAAIDESDIVFAWLDDLSAIGTFVELGYARARDKTVIVVTPSVRPHYEDSWGGHGGPIVDDSPLSEAWFAFECASDVFRYDDPIKALEPIVKAVKRREMETLLESPIEKAFWHAYLDKQLLPLAGLTPALSVMAGKYRLDFALPDLMIGIELDGFEFHNTRDQFNRDRARQRELEMEGWRIIRFGGSEVHNDAAGCVSQAARLVAQWQRSTTSDVNLDDLVDADEF